MRAGDGEADAGPRADLALNHDDAIALLAFLLASSRSCLFDPPGYGTSRLATAAERLAATWAPRTTGSLATYLRDLASSVPAQEWDPMGAAPETEAYLDELIASLAREVARDGSEDADA
ncbi:MAG: DUF6092 family protein [Actinomycetota bacterium]